MRILTIGLAVLICASPAIADEIILKPGDVVRTECAWDRSLRDPELEPAYVLWADGTDDEMCFATITVRPR